jgi:hypothetical protein
VFTAKQTLLLLTFCNTVEDCGHSQLLGHSNNVGKLCATCKEADGGAETSTENREAANSLLIRLEVTSEGKSDPDDRPVPLI